MAEIKRLSQVPILASQTEKTIRNALYDAYTKINQLLDFALDHSSSHATGGSDALTPEDIGAAATGALPTTHFAITSAVRQLISSVTPVIVTGLSITITPKSVNSKFLIMAVVNGSMTWVSSSLIYRNGSPILTHTGNSNEPGSQATTYLGGTPETVAQMSQHVINYVDTPQLTTAITYDVRCTSGWSGTVTPLYINGRGTYDDMRTPSTLTIIEF